MKKLMIAMAAMTAGVAMADIVSSSVVGYQTKSTVSGFNFVSPTFTAVNGGSIDIQDIKLDPNTATSWSDEIQVLDEGGATVEVYVFATADESGLESDGWVDQDGELATRSITTGMSVLVNTADSTSVTFAGAVGTTSTVVSSVAGFNFVGNNTPVDIDIQEIKLDSATATSWSDEIQILDEGGATVEVYVFATAEESGLEADGWVDQDGELATRNIPSGLGVLVNTANDGVSITIPSAL